MRSAAKSSQHAVQICCVRWALSWLRLRLLDVAIKHSAAGGSERQKHAWPRRLAHIPSHKTHFIMVPVNGDGIGTRARNILYQNSRVLRAPRENGARNGARGATLAWQGAFQPGSGCREIRYH